ncbi:MAG TPA: YpdA family putative bacillithiol disulfide reductase [Flavobacteriia bacterium]|nr:YpdA family putative bacillithiol disulfide reductase [Flavobacteriia bacterium]
MKIMDVIIIGGGPIGIACGIEAQKEGLSYLILEKGCIVNSLYNYPQGMTFFSTSEKLEIGGIPFISNNVKPVKAEALEYYRRISDYKELNVNLFEEVIEVKNVENTFRVATSKASYKAKKIIIATGFYDIPNLINVPGEQLPKVSHYYNKDPHFYAHQKVIVIGASNSAVDAALEIYRKGGDVTMVIREGEIGKRVKYWVRPDIINRIKEGSIKAYYHAEVKEIKENEVLMNTKEGVITIKNDYVLALTGYMPNFDFLQKIGIQISDDEKKRPHYNSNTMETNVKGIYLAGVVCGGMETHKWFIENSRIHAPIIMNHIKSKM